MLLFHDTLHVANVHLTWMTTNFFFCSSELNYIDMNDDKFLILI